MNTEQQAQLYYDKAKKQIESWTNLKIKALPSLQLVDLDTMRTFSHYETKVFSTQLCQSKHKNLTPPKHVAAMKNEHVQPALKKSEPTESKHSKAIIYILNNLNDEVFRVAAIHGLMHSIIHENFPHIETKPAWVQEGICQYAAAEFCRQKLFAECLDEIEHSKSTEKRNGYKYICDKVGFQGWNGLRDYMEDIETQTLPIHPPRNR